jgi:hypothetical protein
MEIPIKSGGKKDDTNWKILEYYEEKLILL